jgi:hypothetical protein
MAAVHTTGSTEEHLAARIELLAAEKELTRRGDKLARMRRALPWVAVEKEYIFDTDEGEKNAGRAVRRPLAAARLPLHVRPEMDRRLPGSAHSGPTASTVRSSTWLTTT